MLIVLLRRLSRHVAGDTLIMPWSRSCRQFPKRPHALGPIGGGANTRRAPLGVFELVQATTDRQPGGPTTRDTWQGAVATRRDRPKPHARLTMPSTRNLTKHAKHGPSTTPG